MLVSGAMTRISRGRPTTAEGGWGTVKQQISQVSGVWRLAVVIVPPSIALASLSDPM